MSLVVFSIILKFSYNQIFTEMLERIIILLTVNKISTGEQYKLHYKLFTLIGWISACGGFPSAISNVVIPNDQISALQSYPISCEIMILHERMDSQGFQKSNLRNKARIEDTKVKEDPYVQIPTTAWGRDS